MSTDNIGTEFLENSGLLEMAEANQIVMLFPQVFTSFSMYNLFMTSKNEFSNSSIHEFKVLHKSQRSF